MKRSISNIAWTQQQDSAVYDLAAKYGFSGIEIAPTRVIPEKPYLNAEQAAVWARELRKRYGFCVPSMQSIWFGRQESIFGSEEERKALISYTKLAIEFAETLGCSNLVFGCPRNRNLPEGTDSSAAVDFFREIGEYARAHHTVIGMEANPPIYNTNYINTTEAALELIDLVDSDGFKLNLDVGTMVHNGETVDLLMGKTHLINHVHISEPGLRPIERRQLHKELIQQLQRDDYQGFVSIEMGRQEDITVIANAMEYVTQLMD